MNKNERIKFLEDALVDELVKQQFWCGVVPSIDERRMVARRMLQAEGKIGPDADAKPQVWQITEERKAAIDRSMRFLSWANAKTNKPEIDIDLEVLRAMLTEAEQE